jgi:RND family efflux transporter MFP subunit
MPLDKAALETLRLDRESGPERYRAAPARRTRWWILAAVVGLLLAALSYRWLNAPVEVRTAPIESPRGAAGDAVLNASGYVVARRVATVSSKVTGQVSEVLIEEGQAVQEGQVLARLDDTTARAEYTVADRSLESARRNLAEIEVRLSDARRTLQRNQAVFEKKLAARSVVDASEAEVAALAARLEVASSEVAVAQSSLALRRQALEDLLIRAPFPGVVISKDAQPGEMVSPISAGGGFTRTGIATIVDMDSREIEVDVNEAYINRVSTGQRVEAALDAYPDQMIPGHVISIVPTADRQKATVRVRIAFDALDPRILPDMGIKVGFLDAEGRERPASRITLPVAAVVREGDSTRVWLVRDGKVERRAVRLGEPTGETVPVLEGLSGGEVVVVDPPTRLRDGVAVELRGD